MSRPGAPLTVSGATLAIVSINGWNRLNIAARTVPGDFVPGSLAKLHAVS
jgi:hypothetical protein